VILDKIQSIFFGKDLQSSVIQRGKRPLAQKLRSYSNSKKEFEDFEHGNLVWPGDYWQTKKELEALFLELLDGLHCAIECVDELLLNKIQVHAGMAVKEVLALHLAAIFDHQQELNGQLAQCLPENPEEKILINFYFDKIHPTVVEGVQGEKGDSLSWRGGTVGETSAIWVALVFRMLAWLVLHDFDPKDTMIERSEFMNNVLPVYIG